MPFEVFLPENLAEIGVNGKEVIVRAGYEGDLLEPAVGDGALSDQRSVQRVHRPLLRRELDLPEQLQVLDAVLRDLRFVLLPAASLKVAAVRHPVRRRHRNRDEACQENRPDADSTHVAPF